MANREPKRGKRFKPEIGTALLSAILLLRVVSPSHVTASDDHDHDDNDAERAVVNSNGKSEGGGKRSPSVLQHVLDKEFDHHRHHHHRHNHHDHHHDHDYDHDHHHHHRHHRHRHQYHQHLRRHGDREWTREQRQHLRDVHHRHHHRRQRHQSPHRYQDDDDLNHDLRLLDDGIQGRRPPYQTTHEVWKNPCGPGDLLPPGSVMMMMTTSRDDDDDDGHGDDNDGGNDDDDLVHGEGRQNLEETLGRAADRLKNLYRAVLGKFVDLRLEDSIPDEGYNLGGFYNNMSDVINMTSSIDNETSFGDWLSVSYSVLRKIEFLTLEMVKDEERTWNEPFTFASEYIRILDDSEGGIRFVLCAIYSSPDLVVDPDLELATSGLTPVPSNTLRHDRDYCFLRDSYDVVARLTERLEDSLE